MGSVFDLLERVRARPGMYVGGDGEHRGVQLRNLELYLFGYAEALAEHGLKDPGIDLLERLNAYLGRRFRWSTSCGPIDAIIRHTPDQQAAWERFWRLLDDFKKSPEGRGEIPAPSASAGRPGRTRRAKAKTASPTSKDVVDGKPRRARSG